MSCSFYHLNESVLVGSKALAKWTRKSMQVDTSSQNQNLHTDLQWAAKQIHISAHKFTQVVKSHKFHAYTVDVDQLVSTCIGWPNSEKLN